jgi:cell wall assembly regulator SMI1
MPVAAIEDIFDGKIWAATDPDKRLTKQLKDKTDIARLLEVKPELENKLPNNMRDLLPKRKKKNKSKRL